MRITNHTRRTADELVARTFATAEAEQRIQAARANVDLHQVNVEQWEVFFNAGYYSRARAFWFSEVEGAK